MAEDDCGLMLRYAGGDLQAFATLYARHRGALYRYLVRHVRERAAADDLFQEVWSRVIAHRAHYEPRAKFSTFLYHIAHHCCIDYLRRAAARPHREVSDEEARGDPRQEESGESRRVDAGWWQSQCAPDGDRPDVRAEQAEWVARYRTALGRLPAEQRDVFLLYEQSGLSLDEIATITGVGPETVKSRLRYALAKLRRALAPSSEGPSEGPGEGPSGVPSSTRTARDPCGITGPLAAVQIIGEPGS